MASKRWEADGRLKPGSLSECQEYFRNRYFCDGKFTDHFRGLYFRDNDNEALVQMILRDENARIGDIVAGLLIIAYRLPFFSMDRYSAISGGASLS